MKPREITLNFTAPEVVKLKACLGDKGYIHKDLEKILNDYIHDLIKDKKKETKKKVAKITLKNQENESFKFEKDNIICIKKTSKPYSKIDEFSVVYIEDGVVREADIAYRDNLNKSKEEYDKLIKKLDLEKDYITLEKPNQINKSIQYLFNTKQVKEVDVQKRNKVIFVYGPNGFFVSFKFYQGDEEFKKSLAKIKKRVL